jgi:hypothetical protein
MRGLLYLLLISAGINAQAPLRPANAPSGWKKGEPKSQFKPIRAQAASAQAVTCLYDTLYYYTEDTVTKQWKLTERANLDYDANNNNTSTQTEAWTGSSWANAALYTSAYNANNQVTNELEQQWNVSMWQNAAQTQYSYNGATDLVQMLHQNWSGTAWNNIFQNLYTYDANHNCLTLISQNWNGGSWQNASGQAYSYDLNNNVLTEKMMNWNGAAWDTMWKSSHSYNGSQLKTLTLGEYWNGTDWDTSSLTSYFYNTGNLLIRELTLGWTGTWDSSQQVLYSYDINGNQTSMRYQQYNMGWADLFLNESSYCSNNCIATVASHGWFVSPDQKLDSITTACSFYVSLDESGKGINNLYPNPSSGTLLLERETNEEAAFTITDLSGKVVQQGRLQGEHNTLDLSMLEPSVYFFELFTKNGRISRKIVMMR